MTTPPTTPAEILEAVFFGLRALISLRDDVMRLDHALAFVDDNGSALCDTESIRQRVDEVADLCLALRIDSERLRGRLMPDKVVLGEATAQHIGEAVLVLGQAGHFVAAEEFGVVARAGVIACGIPEDHIAQLAIAIIRLAGHAETRGEDELKGRAEAVADLVARVVIDHVLRDPTALKLGAGDLSTRMKSLLGRPQTIAAIAHVLKGGTA